STLKKVTADLSEKFGFNTAISALMELINDMYKYKELDNINEAVIKEGVQTIVTIIAPFAPHLGEELWTMIGKEGSVFDIDWPKYDEKALVKDEIEVVVQVNGKVRGKLTVNSNISKDEMEKVALEDEKIKGLVEGKTIVKVVAVPKKLVNIVVK
ncbi:MAG: class I tRNA ligase family protein, partial [Clostridioides difficile]|nr:class I tRNA ligase family protein [Clostridioides difficile]